METLLKEAVEHGLAADTAPTRDDLAALTQAVLPQIGQVLLQALAMAQGSGLVGPARPWACGGEQISHDQARPLVVQTRVGAIRLALRASSRGPACRARGFPLDDRLGLGPAGRMSR